MVPTREEPTPFVIDGRLNTLAAMDDYFAMVRRMFPHDFADTSRRYFFEFDDPTKTLDGLYDASSGARLDKGAHYDLTWSFDQYCHNTVGSRGYKAIGNKDLSRFLKAYWGLRNLQADRGVGAVSLDVATYYAMSMGAALQSLAQVKGRQFGRDIEDWAV
ncbi:MULTISPECIES: hypothetical protein [Asticcacaulis]|uniref:hypothetical protein n=1 Tax=Asticcacaulis TaxID=76890 RepID=UPI001AE122E3|nr:MULTISPECIES: hypothetical protein [Asticcacaulis]MBP2159047.1 hypothetical protein [Asticcacaulis solisilvae]MDR6800092.1 hypothetical protein [Asticcacaulis sp. BE141]